MFHSSKTKSIPINPLYTHNNQWNVLSHNCNSIGHHKIDRPNRGRYGNFAEDGPRGGGGGGGYDRNQREGSFNNRDDR